MNVQLDWPYRQTCMEFCHAYAAWYCQVCNKHNSLLLHFLPFRSVGQLIGDEGSYLLNGKTNLLIALHALSNNKIIQKRFKNSHSMPFTKVLAGRAARLSALAIMTAGGGGGGGGAWCFFPDLDGRRGDNSSAMLDVGSAGFDSNLSPDFLSVWRSSVSRCRESDLPDACVTR